MTRTACLWLVIAMTTVTTSRARGDNADADARRDGLLAIGGTAERRDLTTIEVAVTGVLRAAAWHLPASPLAKRETEGLMRCLDATDDSCIPDAVHAKSLRHALVVAAAKAQAIDGTDAVILTGKLIAIQPAAFVVRQRRCEPCTDDSLQRAARDLARELLDELAVRLGRTLLVITTVPEGAHVVLDGTAIGATNMNVKTFPGAHAIELAKAGFVTVRRDVQAEEGKTTEIEVALRGADLSPPPAPHARATAARPWLPGVGLIAGGALGIAGGVALLVLGHEDGPDDRFRYRHATLLGAGALVVALAAGGYGAYLLTVRTTPGGAVAGVERTF